MASSQIDPKELGTCSSPIPDDYYNEQMKARLKALLMKVIWGIGLACVVPGIRRRRSFSGEGLNNHQRVKSSDLEHKAWLLVDSGGNGSAGSAELTAADPTSVHSSFRFSFCSQVELDSIHPSSSCSSAAATTVLMVNLEHGFCDSRTEELKWRRIESLERSISPVASTLIRFSYAQIASATRNFSEGRLLGRGALSCVFRGRFGPLRATVAIKRLDKEDKESAKAFCRELMIASSLHNPNIVPLAGFCIDPEEGLFLVYKYVSGGSLEQRLHEKRRGVKRGRSALPWSVRYKVAIGIADAVAYLHNGMGKCVVHRDIKPSNILLSSNKTPKLCDFGLATWTSAPSVPFLCKTVKGTFGYLAPEYFQHGKVSDKTDVYAFGIVLLELLTGRRPIDAKRPPGSENLVLWVKPHLKQGKGAIHKLIDPQLKVTTKHSNQILRMIHAAAACINSEESQRPGISRIVTILRGE